MSHQYNTNFMSYTAQTSRFAAETVARLLRGWFPIRSVLDVGSAKGTWLAVWGGTGAEDIHGVDGDYVDRRSLVIPIERFSARDLSREFNLTQHFDLVQSLEVAEHIPEDSAEIFVDNLVRHATGLILFSAAPPGQGGEFHVNEQPYEYWRDKFSAREYVACDCLRPRLLENQKVSFWYRYNTLLYIHRNRLLGVPEDVRRTAVPDGAPIRDVSPAWFRLRKALVRHLPNATREWLARSKARHFSR